MVQVRWGAGLTTTSLVLALFVAASGCGARRAGGPLAVLGVGTSSVAWSEASGPRVRVRADFEPEEVAKVAGEIEQMMDLLEAVAFPFEERPNTRVEVVIFTHEDDYEASADRRYTGGHFLDLHYGGLDMPPTIFVRGGWDQARRRTLRHELVHRYVAFYYPQAPLWLNEGLATLYSTLAVEDGQAIIGRRIPAVSKGRVRPLRELLSMSRPEFYVEDDSLPPLDRMIARAANYLGAWMVVHYLTCRDGPWRATLQAYLEGLTRGEREADVYARTFGRADLEALESGMLEHFAFRDLMLLHTAYTPAPPPPVALRPLRRAEVDTLFAWYRTISDEANEPASLALLQRSIEAEPTYAEAYYWRGLIARDRGQPQAALVDLEAALRLEPRSPAYATALVDLALAADDPRPVDERTRSLELLVPALAKVARSAFSLLTVSRALATQGKTGAAHGFAMRATQADVGCAACWHQRAELSWTLGKADDALASIELAAQQAWSREYAARLRARQAELRLAARDAPPAPPAKAAPSEPETPSPTP